MSQPKWKFYAEEVGIPCPVEGCKGWMRDAEDGCFPIPVTYGGVIYCDECGFDSPMPPVPLPVCGGAEPPAGAGEPAPRDRPRPPAGCRMLVLVPAKGGKP